MKQRNFGRFFVIAAGIGMVAATTSLSFAVPPKSDAHAELPLEKRKLANGLEVILHEDHRTPIVSVNLWYHVGSKDEPAGRNGFAHLFEHVMFQGSKHVPEDSYFRMLERAGGSVINGTTNTDRTNYFETVPSNRLELALWLESDRMGFLLDHADEKTFSEQRDVVKNERRQNYENARYGLVGQYINRALYPENHPYHRLTIGTPEDLDRATFEDVRAFFRTWYVPNNATVVIAGDIDKNKAYALVEQYFGPIPSRPLPPRLAVPAIDLKTETKLEVISGVPVARIDLVWPTPAMFASGDGELDLAARILSSGKSSRLYKRLVYDDQIAQNVSAFQASAQLGSTFRIIATAAPGKTPEDLLRAIDDELLKLRTGGVRPEELERAKTSIVSDTLFNLERDAARADLINSFNQLAGDPNYLAKDLARYQLATVDSVNAAVKKWVPASKRVVALVRSQAGAPIAGTLVKTETGKAE